MPLKGKTKIELFNAESGKLEQCIEEDNTLTGALAEIFQGIGRHGHSDSLMYNVGSGNDTTFGFSRGCFTLNQWFGGLLCFDKAQDEEHPFGSYDSTIIAAGVYGQLNGGANQVRGSYNETESVQDFAGKSLTYVYDFATNQGNGRIASVCLTPFLGGLMNEGRARTITGWYGMPVDECHQPIFYDRAGNVSGASSSQRSDWPPLLGSLARGLSNYIDNMNEVYSEWGSDRAHYYYPTNLNCMGEGYWEKVIEVDVENNLYVRAKLELSGGKLYLTFRRFPMFVDEINVWYGNGTSYGVGEDDSPTIEVGDAVYNHIKFQYMSYDAESRILYVVSAPFDIRRYTDYHEQYSVRNAVDVASVIKVYAVHIDPTISDNVETFTIDTYNVPNNTNVTLMLISPRNHQLRNLQFFCYDGYMYVYGPSYSDGAWGDSRSLSIYKIELAHPANVVQIQTNITTFSPYYTVVADAHDGRIYLNFGSSVVRVLNTYTNELYAYEELLHYDYEGYGVTPIRNHFALACENGHLVGVRPNALMTVNNITPVTKTSAQTMKISYTISG